MKKVIPIIALVVLLLQSVLVPIVAVAESINDGPTPLALKEIKVDVLDGNQQVVNQERPAKSEEAYWLHLQGQMEKVGSEWESLDLGLSDNIQVTGEASPLVNQTDQTIGQVLIDGQRVEFQTQESGNHSFDVKIPIKFVGLAKQALISSPLGETVIEVPLIQEETPVSTTASEIESSETETTVASETSDTSSSSQAIEKAVAKNVRASATTAIGNIFDGVKVVVTPNPDKPDLTSQIEVQYKWSLTEEQRVLIQAGDTYTFQLPPELKVTVPALNKDLTNAHGEVVARYTVTTDGQVVFTFTEEVENAQEISGDFWFKTMFNEKLVTTPKEVELKFPIKDKEAVITVPIYSTAEESLEKKGRLDKALNPTNVFWDVYVNKTKTKLTDLTVTDSLPTGLTLTAIKVYEMAVDLNGKVTNDNLGLVPAEEYVVTDGVVSFPGETQKAYRIAYETKIDETVPLQPDGKVDFLNTVSATSKEGKPLTTTAKVTAKYGEALVKDKPVYHSGNQSFDWTVKYNYNEKNIKAADAYLEDNFSDNLLLVDNSVVLHKMEAKADGTYTLGEPLKENTDYTLVPVGDGFRVQFLEDVTYAVNMTYTTKIKEGIVIDDTQQAITNKVHTVGEIESSQGGTTTGQGLIKHHVAEKVNYDKETLSWEIAVNANQYEMKDWVLVDTFPNKGLTFLPGTFEMKEKDGTVLRAGTDYQLSSPDAKGGFSVTLLGQYQTTNKAFTISYDTAFDKTELTAKNSAYKNHAQATWTDKNNQTKTNTSQDEFTPKKETYVNGSKYGSYNAKTKEITWTVNTNYNRDPLNSGRIVDPIPGNQQYIPDSAKLYSYTVASDGKIEALKEITPNSIIVQMVGDVNTIFATLPKNSENVGYQLVFNTTLVGQVVDEAKTYNNTATLEEDGKLKDTVTGSVSIANGGVFAYKGGQQDPTNPDLLNWQIQVNPSQSTLSNVVVKDYPSVNQQLNLDTLTISELTSDVQGKLGLTDIVLVKDRDYTVSVTRDNETGEELMTISFLHEIDKAYLENKPLQVVTS